MTKKHFDIELKLEVVRMISDQGLSISNVSNAMHIGLTAIRRWVVGSCNTMQNGVASPASASR